MGGGEGEHAGQGFHPLGPKREWGEGCRRLPPWSLPVAWPSEGLLLPEREGAQDPGETPPRAELAAGKGAGHR